MLLIHGLGVSGDYYLPVAKLLAPYYDVYILDLPGYGKTPKPVRPLTVMELSKVVVDYVQMTRIVGCVIVGQSMGSQIVANAVTLAPSLFSKMILIAPTVNDKERILFKQGFRLFQDTFYEKFSVNGIVFKNYIRMGIRRFLITSKYMIDDHIEDVLETVLIPTLILRGQQDKIVPYEWVEKLGRITKHSSVFIYLPHPIFSI